MADEVVVKPKKVKPKHSIVINYDEASGIAKAEHRVSVVMKDEVDGASHTITHTETLEFAPDDPFLVSLKKYVDTNRDVCVAKATKTAAGHLLAVERMKRKQLGIKEPTETPANRKFLHIGGDMTAVGEVNS